MNPYAVNPTRDDYQAIAYRDPCLAMGLMVWGGQRQVYKLQARFTSGGVTGNAAPARFRNPANDFFCIFDIAYTVELPEANSGNIEQPTFQVNNEKIPNIDAQISLTAGMSGGLPYKVNSEFQAINTLARATSVQGAGSLCNWGSPWMFPWGSEMQIDHLLTRVYPDSLLPVVVTWSLYTIFIGAAFSRVSEEDACAFLKVRDYHVMPPELRPRQNRSRPGMLLGLD